MAPGLFALVGLLVLGPPGCSDSSGTSADAGAADLTHGDGARADAGPASCSTIPTFADGKQPSRVLHIAVGGSDSTGDGSQAKPFASLGAAAKKAKPGDALRLGPGTHSGGIYLSGLTGTAAAPIWVGGAPGGTRPVISGGNEGLHLVKPRHVVVHDLEVKGAKYNGINCDDGGEYSDAEAARYVLFRGLHIHDVGGTGNQDCLKLSGLRDFAVLDSTFERCGGGGSGSGVDHVGCHRGLIARCTFRDLSGNAVQCKGGSADLEIRWNLMKEAGHRAVNMGGSTGLTYFRPPASKTQPNAEARRIKVIANVIEGAITPFGFVGCVECLAAHNTVVNPGKWLLRILQETKTGSGYTFLAASKGRVINNLFYWRASSVSTHVNVGANTEAGTFTFENNLWYAHDAPAKSAPKLPVVQSNGVTGEDPAFKGAAKGDYTIPATSPAAGKGKALGEVKGDRAGRCYRSPPGVGAYEVHP